MATIVTIPSAAGRAVLLRALWRLASRQIGGERFDQMIYEPDGPQEVVEIDRRIAGLLCVRRAIDAVEDAEIGAVVELNDITNAEFGYVLRSVAQSIAEDEGFWRVTAEQRGTMMAEHDAALALPVMRS